MHCLMRGWGPNLPRGRGKLIGEDLDIDDEVSEQNFEPLCHYTTTLLDINPCGMN
jgi:hypothetical protein